MKTSELNAVSDLAKLADLADDLYLEVWAKAPWDDPKHRDLHRAMVKLDEFLTQMEMKWGYTRQEDRAE